MTARSTPTPTCRRTRTAVEFNGLVDSHTRSFVRGRSSGRTPVPLASTVNSRLAIPSEIRAEILCSRSRTPDSRPATVAYTASGSTPSPSMIRGFISTPSAIALIFSACSLEHTATKYPSASTPKSSTISGAGSRAATSFRLSGSDNSSPSGPGHPFGKTGVQMPETLTRRRSGAREMTEGARPQAGLLQLKVELRGLEPLTPTLPVWCATSCAIAPYLVCSAVHLSVTGLT